MNDRETVVQIMTTILYFDRAMTSLGTPVTSDDLGCMLNVIKIALFPHVSDKTIEEIHKQVFLMDKKILDIMQKTMSFDGPQWEILQ